MKAIYIALVLSFFMISGAIAQSCPATDVPDNLYQDTNGDGIDGDTTHAIFVAITGDDTNQGNIQFPVKTIQKGIELAKLAGKDVYVSMGTYTLTSPLHVASGVSLYGQFNSATGWSRSAANNTIIMGVQTAVIADSIDNDTYIEGFEIDAAAAINPGESSYAVRINGGTATTILRFNTLKPGAGASGTVGTNGSAGGAGTAGSAGGLGSCDGAAYGVGGAGGTSACGRTGGAGGNGGPEGNNAGSNGSVGTGGTLGGTAGGGGDPGGTGQSGSFGTAGANGTNGTAAPAIGTASVNGYTPSAGNNGVAGANGNAGGGGGGGGGQGCTLCNDGSGNGGGGGGGGGCGGSFGTGGTSGGGSFGVFTFVPIYKRTD